MKRFGYTVFTLVILSLYLGLAVWAEGGLGAFLAHRALIGVAITTYVFGFVAMFAGGSLGAGVREDKSNRWVIVPFTLIGLIDGFLPPWTDRQGLWTIDGEVVRWLGLALYAAGCALRIAPVFVLRNRFSGLVAIQRDHRLETDGLYKIVRNPSYDGLLMITLGWALAFRAWAGVILTLLLVPVLIARMNSEERLLASHFGEAYEAYRARTWRLIPWVY